MKNLPRITGAVGLLIFALGLFGLFVSQLTQDDGALLIAGSLLYAAALLSRRGGIAI